MNPSPDDDTLSRPPSVLPREDGITPPGRSDETASYPRAAGAPSPAENGIPPDLANHPRYSILELLGCGGMGTVYKARHCFMDRLVALKIINPHLIDRPSMVERFRREVRTAARLAHPNIVGAYDADQAGDTHFLVMEYIEGVSLDQLVAQQGPLSIRQACDYARQTALGLQHAHERGMVHRDIKPHNLMLTPEGQVKILDFGLALLASEAGFPEEDAAIDPDPDDQLTQVLRRTYRSAAGSSAAPLTSSYMAVGTVDYMAPEEARDARRADIRADIYSLGCTLYRFLTGRVPFPDGDFFQKIRAHHEEFPESLASLRPETPSRLAFVVARMMAKAPDCRYQSPAEVADVLAPFAGPAPYPILVVEDDSITRHALIAALDAKGYASLGAANGLEALTHLREGLRPGLILLDLVMPVMNGWEFLVEQQRDPDLAPIPVVIISSANSDQARALALAAADYVQKPFEMDQLVAKIQRVSADP